MTLLRAHWWLLNLILIPWTVAGERPISLDALPPSSGLPDLFEFNDGTRVASVEDWKRRRGELVEPLLFYQYGRMPPKPDQVTARVVSVVEHESGLGTEEWLRLVIDSEKKLEMRAVLYKPKTAGPHPVIVEEDGNPGGSKNAEMFMAKNYIFLEYARQDLDPDKKDVVGPAQKAYPDYDWATLAVWAWGGMRVVDYLETRGDIDLKHIGITGHSRGGKTALLAGALDERFSLVVPCQSGAGGAGCSRILGPGAESIGMNDKPHWYHERIQSFAEKEAHLPIDQHFLKALVAPRALLCLESTDDLFANPVGTHATSTAVMPVFELHGAPTLNGLRFRRGGHSYTTEDWRALLDFAEWQFFGRPVADAGSFWQRPAEVTPAVGSGGESGFVRIEDPGNKPDRDYPRVGAHGAVGHAFEIGVHRVSNAEYAAFLNAVASETDLHGLHHLQMRIDRRGDEGVYSYTAHPASANAAVTYVSWHDALRYCNWLHGGNSERGAYAFSGATKVGSREAAAKFFLPTEDEWVKAAYYDSKSKGYRAFQLSGHSGAIAISSVELRHPPKPRSPNGMLGIEDPIWEWTESKAGELFCGLRSDSWFQGNNRQAYGRFYINPHLELGHVGFRVARALGGK